jgi:cell division protein FtsI/penicillin-binding protein 2
MKQLLCALALGVVWIAAPASPQSAPAGISSRKPNTGARAAAPKAQAAAKTTRTVARRRPVRTRYKKPVFADAALGDKTGGEDLSVRRAAVQALAGYNGSVVVVDPEDGRVLTIVNQKLAFQSGFTPCSTIKIVTALAALNEGIIERATPVRLSRRLTLDLTTALAQSHLSNGYFGRLGQKVGFDKVRYYAQQFGLGEKAGWNIEEERSGILPETATPGALRLMTAYGTGISQTPLELAAFLAAIANGGTLYYLQYPRTPEEIAAYEPKIKRELAILPWLDDLRVGMRAAVDYGTGRRANFDGLATVLGKTGTCTDTAQFAHLGWFGSYNESGRRLVVVVLLTGDRRVNGPAAAGVAGQVYRNLSVQNLLVKADLRTLACCGN